MDKWEADCAALRKSSGAEDAQARKGRAVDAENEAFKRLADHQPKTLQGVALKVIAFTLLCEDSLQDMALPGRLINTAANDAKRIMGIEKPTVGQ